MEYGVDDPVQLPLGQVDACMPTDAMEKGATQGEVAHMKKTTLNFVGYCNLLTYIAFNICY
jgi:hypothetical protein